MGELNYVIKVPEPTLTTAELSEAVGRLTQTCESLRADLVALEGVVIGRPSLRRKIKAWLREQLGD